MILEYIMNNDLPRVMRMLRKERGLKQKEVAEQLGVGQAILSHYENGKRECGIDFLVAVADFYGVSVDYLLGRTSSRNGMVVFSENLPESTVSESYDGDPAGAGTLLRKKLITNSLEVVFSLLMKAKNNKLARAVSSYLMTSVYRAYRIVFSAGRDNDDNSFAISTDAVADVCAAKMALDDVAARVAAKDGSSDEKITNLRIEREYPRQSAAIFSVVTNVEKDLEKLN